MNLPRRAENQPETVLRAATFEDSVFRAEFESWKMNMEPPRNIRGAIL